jgi:hypothetical protein
MLAYTTSGVNFCGDSYRYADNIPGKCAAIFLGRWHSEEDMRGLEVESMAIETKREVSLWTKHQGQVVKLGYVQPCSQQSTFYHWSNVGEWLDDRTMEDDIPIFDDEPVYVFIGDSDEFSRNEDAGGANTIALSEVAQFLALVENRGEEMKFVVSRPHVSGHSHSHYDKDGDCDDEDVDDFFDGFDAETREAQNCSSSWTWKGVGALVFFLMVFMLFLYFVKNYAMKWWNA